MAPRNDDSAEALLELRQRLEQVKNNEKITKSDFNRIFREDWWPLSFLIPYDYDVDIAYAVIIECLKWRTSFKINYISLLELRPLLEKSAIYLHGQDIEGRSILWIKMNQVKVGEQNINKLLVYWLERHSTETHAAPLTVIFDMCGTGLQNMSLDFIKFLLHSFKYYFPCCLASLLIFENPSILNASWKLVRSWMDSVMQRYFQHVTRTSITNFISSDYLPHHMGGQDNFVFTMDELARCIPTQSNSEPVTDDTPPVYLESFAEQRNVTFDSDKPVVLSSTENTTSRPTSIIKRSSNPLPINLQLLADARKNALLSETITTRFLTICPKDEITLNTVSGELDPVDVIALKNEGVKNVIYKIKITSPEKFRVRPCTGIIGIGETEFVRVHLQNEYKHTINREKFLIMAVEAELSDDTDFATLWKNSEESSKVEHKLKCHLSKGIGSSPPPTGVHATIANHPSSDSSDHNDDLRQQITEIAERQRYITIGIVLLIGLQILSLISILTMHSSIRSPHQHLSASEISPMNVEPIDVDSDL